MKASGFISPKIPLISMHLGLLYGAVRTEHLPKCLSIIHLAQRIDMGGERERVDLGTYVVSIVVAMWVGESATYEDDQRRLGLGGKCSIHYHGVVCVVLCLGRYEQKGM